MTARSPARSPAGPVTAPLFDCTEAGTLADVYEPLFNPGDVVGHGEHEQWRGTVDRTSRPTADGKHHFHVRWEHDPRRTHEYTAYDLYRIAAGPLSRQLAEAKLRTPIRDEL